MDAGGERLAADRVVVALGAWSKPFLAGLGVTLPLAYERGYHRHFASAGQATLRRPIYDAEGGYVLSPMAQGLRLSTGVELDDIDAPKRRAQITQAERAAREAIALGESLDPEPWLGHRPTLPDCRPLIGEAPHHPGLWLAVGHQHIGFSTGPGTARVLAALMSNEAPPIDATPFRAARFVR